MMLSVYCGNDHWRYYLGEDTENPLETCCTTDGGPLLAERVTPMSLLIQHSS
jgi:hypothetical protein